MALQNPPTRTTLVEALARIPAPSGKRYVTVFKWKGIETGLYAPRGVDPQSPHARDEVYVVVRGSGLFAIQGRREHVQPGDLLFVPAGVEHRFEEFTDDLVVWVIFFDMEVDPGEQ